MIESTSGSVVLTSPPGGIIRPAEEIPAGQTRPEEARRIHPEAGRPFRPEERRNHHPAERRPFHRHPAESHRPEERPAAGHHNHHPADNRPPADHTLPLRSRLRYSSADPPS